MKPTLRDLFWLILVAAAGLGWWVDRAELQSELIGMTQKANNTQFGYLLNALEIWLADEGYEFTWDRKGKIYIDSPKGTSLTVNAPEPGRMNGYPQSEIE